MKATIELTFEIDGNLAPERLAEILPDHLAEHVCIASEQHGDGEKYIAWINAVEVKEVK